jgi:predicted dehydrogenase
MDRISRRRFLEDSLALLAVSAIPTAAMAESSGATRRRVSPNDKIRVAVIGLHGRGMNHVESYAEMDDVEIVALCDADTATFGRALAAIDKKGKPKPRMIQDVRKLVEDKEIDVVSIATPNHWHALGAIWAMQNGKDVYLEKPVSHNVSEGRRITQVARKLNRICQCGTQSRASKGVREAMAYMHEGNLGKISVSRGLCYKPRKSIGKVDGPQMPPSSMDYDLWCGPAPNKPPHRNTNFGTVHYDWHWFWDYGNGDIGNQGIHEMDKARWGLGKPGLPKSVMALGGRFGYVDDGETPNTMLAFYDYGDSQLIFEVRGLDTPPLHGVNKGDAAVPKAGAKVGNIFYGEKGVLVMPSYSDAVAFDNDGNKIAEFHGGGDHFRNFLQAVRSRKKEELYADIEEGHYSSALCHLANISYKLGSPQPFNAKTKTFGDNKLAYEALGRCEEHLAANNVSLTDTQYRLGRDLVLDAKHESFGSDKEANVLLTREYRKGFEVPSKA